MLEESVKNADESYVLVPLENLVRNSRQSKVASSGKGKDPLYLMFPFKEISRKTRLANTVRYSDNPSIRERQFGRYNLEPLNRRGNLYGVVQPHLPKGKNIFLLPSELKANKEINKRQHQYFPPIVLPEKDFSRSFMQYNPHADWRVPLERFMNNKADLVSKAPESSSKSKKSLEETELKSQAGNDLFSSHSQKSKVFPDFRDLNPKMKGPQNILTKQTKKSQCNPVNITFCISNLVPPCEVDCTKITNWGKLMKNGNLKFSIQLERPGSLPCEENVDDCSPAPPPKTCNPSFRAGCGHLERLLDDKNPSLNNGLCALINATYGNVNPAVNSWQGSAFKSNPGSSVLLDSNDYLRQLQSSLSNSKSSPVSRPALSTECPIRALANLGSTLNNGDINAAVGREFGSLLLQLLGVEKKPMKKPTQATPLDSDILKELQKFIVALNQGNAGSLTENVRPVFGSSQTSSPAIQHQKVKTIADALNLFSKLTPPKQNNIPNS